MDKRVRKEFARRYGVSEKLSVRRQSGKSNIENNRVKVSLPTLIYICNALGVTVDYVLSGEYTGDYSSIDREIMKEIQSLSEKETLTSAVSTW